MWPFSRKVRRQLGVDIGTSSVKVVELEQDGNHVVLSNYGIMDGSDFFGEVRSGSNIPLGFKMSENDIALVLKQLLSSAKMKSDTVVMSVPIFSSFITVMELPNLNGKELENAVPFEARAYIPVPLSEVVLDWIVVPTSTAGTAQPQNQTVVSTTPKTEKITVLLIAVPKEVVSKYQRIAEASGLKLAALESESFSLARSLVGKDMGTIMLMDLGARSSNITIIDGGYIFMSHSAELSGREITRVVSSSLNITPERAEELKRTTGIASLGAEKGIAQVISPFVGKLVNEAERMNSLFLKKDDKKIEKIVLTGGAANLPGLAEYLSRNLGVEVLLGNPFSHIKFDPVLEPVFRKELSSVLAVPAGLAMRGL